MNNIDRLPKIMCDWDQSNQGWKTLWKVIKFMGKVILWIIVVFGVFFFAMTPRKD